MNQRDVIKLAREAGFMMENTAAIQAAENFANAVIKHYIETSVTELTGLPYAVPAHYEEQPDGTVIPVDPSEMAQPAACNPLCELCVKRGYSECANVAKTTPLPALAQPEPVSPLSPEKVKEILRESGYDTASAKERADFINGIRHCEVAHGIIGAAALAQPEPCTNDEWLANCPQKVRDFAAKVKAEKEQK